MAGEITLPALGENVDGGDVVDIKVAAGEQVRQGQALLEVEAEKSTVEVPSPQAGRITEVLVKKGERVTTGQPLFRIEVGNGGALKPAPAAEAPKEPARPAPPRDGAVPPPPAPARAKPVDGARAAPPAEEAPEKLVPAGPATRRLARELGVDLRLVRGTAPSG